VISNTHTHNPSHLPLQAILGLDQQPARPMQHDKFFFASPLISQRLAVLHRLIGSRSPIILIIGERGSGKTTLMNRLIHDGRKPWKVCRIRLKPKGNAEMTQCQNLDNRLVFLTKKEGARSVIIDDAHQLNQHELQVLIQSSFSSDRSGSNKFQSIVLFAEPQIRRRLADIAGWLPSNSVIEKIHITPLTEEQTADYLRHRVKIAGLSERDLFSIDQIHLIYKQSGGLPGWINQKACMLLQHREQQHLIPLTVRQKMNFEQLKDNLQGRLSRIFKS
jgi:type II secretory pathway predicted ATPase ExeA